MMFGTMLFSRKPFAFTLMQVRKMQTRLVPWVMKSLSSFAGKGTQNFWGNFKSPEKMISFVFILKIRYPTETTK